MSSYQTRMTGGGRIVIPAKLRKKLGLIVGEEVVLREDEHGRVRLLSRSEAVREGIARAQEIFRRRVPAGQNLVDEFLAQRRAEAEAE